MSTEGDSGMMPAAIEETTGITEQVMTETEEPQSQGSTPLPERTMSNEEVMIAQALSRIKKNTKVLEKTNKMLGQVLETLKRGEKESAVHSRQVTSQNKKLLSQIAQLQKRMAKIKSTPKPKPVKKKKSKVKAKPRRR
jgi:hypothetical protein